MKNLGQVNDLKDLVTKEYVDVKVQTDVPSGAVFTDTVYTHPETHDVSMITDTSADNVFSGDHKISNLMYFKNNSITNISQVYKSGFYGTKNTDTTTPYAGYWFVAVFCKDLVNQIAVQWAMNVGKDHNGELWMRTVRLNAATTGDGNMVGTWQRVLNKTYGDELYAQLSHIHAVATSSSDGFIAAADKAKLDAIEAEAEANLLEVVKVNGVVQTITDKSIDITVPTKTSDLTNDSGYLTTAPVTSVNGQTGAVTVEAGVQKVSLTQAEYNALTIKDPNTIYVITDEGVAWLMMDDVPTSGSDHVVSSGGIYTALGEKIDADDKGVAGGVASLDATGKVPSGQLPSMDYVPTTRKVNNKALSANITLNAADVGAAASSHTHAASAVTSGTLAGRVQANASAMSTVSSAQVRDIYAGTSDLTAGSSALTTGTLYFVYE